MTPRRPLVAFYGDSITRGTHSTHPQVFTPITWDPTPVAHMAALAAVDAIDYSRDGASSADAAIHADASALVVIRFGVADAVYGMAPDTFTANIASLVAQASALGKRALLTGLTHATACDTAPLDAAMRACAHALDLPFVDVRALPFTEADLADGLHPGLAYSRRVGVAVAAAIATACRG